MKGVSLAFFVCVLFFIAANAASTEIIQNTVVALSQSEQTWLKQREGAPLRYCFSPVWKPYDFLEDGKHKGIFADYLQLFSQRLNLPLQPVLSNTWGEALQFVREGRCDFLSGAVKTPEREDFLSFTTPYYQTSHVLLAKSGQPFVQSLADIADQKIVIPTGGAVGVRLRQDYPRTLFIEAETPDALFEKVENGEAYAGVASFAHGVQIIQQGCIT